MHSTITIIRHAPTEYNKRGVFMGTSDIPIDRFDEESINSVKENLSIQPYSFLYTSPLKRASDTAKAIVSKKVKLLLMSGLLNDAWETGKAFLKPKYRECIRTLLLMARWIFITCQKMENAMKIWLSE